MDWNNRVVIITGASSGIGKALALQAAEKGARIAVCARNIDALEAAYAHINDHQKLTMSIDVSNEEACKDFINAVLERWGRIDVLINNAGMSMRAMFKDVDLKVIKQLMDINFWGTVYMTKYALPSIIENKGSITGISSIAGYRGLPARTGYSASKFAMNGFLESLRTELLKNGVHVMTASPGFTASNIRNTSMTADGSAQKETPLNESKLMSAETCASIILQGIERRKRSIIMTGQGKLTVFLNKWLGKVMDNIVYNHFKKEPDSPLK